MLNLAAARAMAGAPGRCCCGGGKRAAVARKAALDACQARKRSISKKEQNSSRQLLIIYTSSTRANEATISRGEQSRLWNKAQALVYVVFSVRVLVILI